MGEPNEEAKRRGFKVGSRVVVEDGVITDFDADGCPVVDIEDGKPPAPYELGTMYLSAPYAPSATAFDRVKEAAFVALYLRIDSRDLSDEQVEQALARADQIAVNYVAALKHAEESDALRAEVLK